MDQMEASLRRGFRPIEVKNFIQQDHADRFTFLQNVETPQRFPIEESLPPNVEKIREKPKPAPWRLNLVALSQKHNLYFAAYRQSIHVIIPRGMNRTLPGKPSLIINLPRSDKALKVGGYLSTHCPHFVNQIVVGNLGNKEILLVACDDGDVIGYYTDLIHKSANSSPPLPERLVQISTLQPFFHENVNLSAWGLAIHEQTRLIAVSSNLRQVTIFIHATNNLHDDLISNEEVDEEWINTRWESTSHKVEKFPILAEEQQFKEAAMYKDGICRGEGCLQNLRIVINLGNEGHNIPSIAFASDAHGVAESIVATDINGNLWILDIWDNVQTRIPSLYTTLNNHMGWGALVLPLQYFKRTQTVQEALGIPLPKTLEVFDDKGPMAHFNISPCISDIWPIESKHFEPDDLGLVMEHLRLEPMGPTILGETESSEGSDDNDREDADDRQEVDDSEDSDYNPSDRVFSLRTHSVTTFDPIARERWSKAEKHKSEWIERARFDEQWFLKQSLYFLINVIPTLVEHERTPGNLDDLMYEYSRILKKGFSPAFWTLQKPNFYISSQCAILRTYAYDIELIGPTTKSPRTVCRNPIKTTQPLPVQGLDRISYLSLIPELSLVVVATGLGRVALLTITRQKDGFSVHGPVLTYRLDLTLPREGVLKDYSPLMGMAVAPCRNRDSEREMEGEEQRIRMRRWNLILHYTDNMVLTYELGRDEESGDVLIW